MTLEQTLTQHICQAAKAIFNTDLDSRLVQLQKTKKEFEGNITLVVFPFVKMLRRAPQEVAQQIGNYLADNAPEVEKYNVVQGFLNITIAKTYWAQLLEQIYHTDNYGFIPVTPDSKLMMVEYSSPNTNKPLHLGHVRNNLLGYSIAKIQEANGWKVIKTNIVNDRGIHICKSMLAWQLYGNGETPASSGKKGDHLIGDYYVLFDRKLKQQIEQLVDSGVDIEKAKQEAPLIKQAHDMLRRWEQGDPEVRQLWQMMNQWVYDGFDQTYKMMGVDFDKIYYESNTYLEGKQEVLRGLEQGIFVKHEDGSVWADLTKDGLDEKILLRSDGTSVYITQDIGTAKLRYQDFPIDKMVYVVGNEQEYHFKVLSIILDRLGFRFGKDLVHFSYGMVELPNGKMKSREGTVVDADDLMQEMILQAKEVSKDKTSKLTDISTEEADDIARKVGLGALKYFILKVDPRKNMLFNPEESIDFNGNTGPFIQYTYARIRSLQRKATEQDLNAANNTYQPQDKEVELIQRLADFPTVLHQAGIDFSPALIANYCYALASDFNSFYHDYSVLGEPDAAIRRFRLMLAATIGDILKEGMQLLGIEMPERM